MKHCAFAGVFDKHDLRLCGDGSTREHAAHEWFPHPIMVDSAPLFIGGDLHDHAGIACGFTSAPELHPELAALDDHAEHAHAGAKSVRFWPAPADSHLIV
jgi:hypothetical protein